MVFSSLLNNLGFLPEFEDPLKYVSAILDMIEEQLWNSEQPLSQAFRDYPNLHTLISLLQDFPEIFEMAVYTGLQVRVLCLFSFTSVLNSNDAPLMTRFIQ
jgi:hypothetical protein